MAANSQQFGTRQDTSNKRLNEVTISSLDDSITNLASLVQNMAAVNMHEVKAYGICDVIGHATDM